VKLIIERSSTSTTLHVGVEGQDALSSALLGTKSLVGKQAASRLSPSARDGNSVLKHTRQHKEAAIAASFSQTSRTSTPELQMITRRSPSNRKLCGLSHVCTVVCSYSLGCRSFGSSPARLEARRSGDRVHHLLQREMYSLPIDLVRGLSGGTLSISPCRCQKSLLDTSAKVGQGW
jgi:hypothetical protein